MKEELDEQKVAVAAKDKRIEELEEEIAALQSALEGLPVENPQSLKGIAQLMCHQGLISEDDLRIFDSIRSVDNIGAKR